MLIASRVSLHTLDEVRVVFLAVISMVPSSARKFWARVALYAFGFRTLGVVL